jgi:bacterioferritin-associated ferredoxin
MNPDDHVCLCFHVSQRKIVNYCQREQPPVASLISECLSAGTGCGWCIPFLKSLHKQCLRGDPNPDLPFSPEDYARNRQHYRQTGQRPADTDGNDETPDSKET